MTRRVLLMPLAILMLFAGALPCTAAVPTDELLPATTKGYLSVVKMSEFRAKWDATQLGQMMNDPLMKPFVEDFQEQMRSKLGKSGKKVGVQLEDLEGLCDGELCLAAVQPGGDAAQHALVAVVDVTGHADRAAELLEKIRKHQLSEGAKRTTAKVGPIETIVYVKPKSKDRPEPEYLYQFIHEETLVSTDHAALGEMLAKRMTGARPEPLKSVAAFRESFQKVTEASGDTAPHVRWFVEPFGYAQVSRAAQGGKKKRGTDMLKVLANQGFTAVQGAAGQITLATGDEEILHRSFIYAPQDPAAKKGDKYRLAARMLSFPNSNDLQPQPWVPSGAASYLSLNAKIQDAFEYVSTLVDEIAGEPGVFDEVIKSIAVDRNGPQVDLRKHLVAHATGRVSVFSDCRLPVTPKSERLAIAFGVQNVPAVAKAIDKIMESDPNAKKHVIDGQVVWEIINEEESVEVETLKIEGVEFTSTEGEAAADEEEEEEEDKPVIPNSAVTVAHGHLIWATHVDFIKDVLAPADAKLTAAQDFQAVEKALARLKVAENSMRSFVRTDEAYRATYELLQQGKMPESETVLAKILNRMLGPDEEGVLREQQIDGAKLPAFDMVRKYLGAAGMSVHSQDDGWLVVGCLLARPADAKAE